MARNVAGAERTARSMIGAILIIVGIFLSGVWRPVSIIVGSGLLLTALVAY